MDAAKCKLVLGILLLGAHCTGTGFHLQCPGQASMGARSLSTKNWGWVVTRRRCLNISMHAPHPWCKVSCQGVPDRPASSLCNLLCAIFRVQSSLCNPLCAIFCVQFSMCNLLCDETSCPCCSCQGHEKFRHAEERLHTEASMMPQLPCRIQPSSRVQLFMQMKCCEGSSCFSAFKVGFWHAKKMCDYYGSYLLL